ncbi:hypothetical protein IGB42_01907 [Andreprevotia sp. IGB-42]|uniref:hypothetical protein n=1 Tax=Andreprevotia sp. IGB-42 TaxID=2497473 RepID=UPI0013575497|nr:hypothetical protein [Andreprevotia sp. IGB-42]KAF0813556.1 hypothetical protein IGB42_01907 [Andreprevotia sp. IGB-42]
MSLDHKAYQFDWNAFSASLLPLLQNALTNDNADALRGFIQANLNHCSSPHDGEPLDSGWETQLTAHDIQELADFALTRHYDPAGNHGLGGAWQSTAAHLPEAAQAALLGNALPGFDPGRQGAYFQTPDEVIRSIHQLAQQSHPATDSFRALLRAARQSGHGIYVTF